MISPFVAGTFLANHVTVEKNNRFEDISGFFLSYESGGDGFYSEDTGERGDFFKNLEQAFHADGKIMEADRRRDPENEVLVEFMFGPWHTRYMAALINLQEGYLVSDTGKMYLMSGEFCRAVSALSIGVMIYNETFVDYTLDEGSREQLVEKILNLETLSGEEKKQMQMSGVAATRDTVLSSIRSKGTWQYAVFLAKVPFLLPKGG